MATEEIEKLSRYFSAQFDILYNNISSNMAPGLSEYEKSVLLTKAQNEIVKNCFEPVSRGNSIQKGYDGSAIRQADFSNLLRSEEKQPVEGVTPLTDYRAKVYELPEEMLAITSEQILLKDGEGTVLDTRLIVPLSNVEYARLMSKPFKEPLKRQAWRLLINTGTANRAEIVLPSTDKSSPWYQITYVKQPEPIILEAITDSSLNIEGKTAMSACELHENLHDMVIQRAVEIAKTAWEEDANQQQLLSVSGQRSE